MPDLLNPDALQYFFGAHFNVSVAMGVIPRYKDAANLERELADSIKENRPHLGIQLIGYHDIDTGFSSVAMIRNPGKMSGISFYAQSTHRVFGGHTLMCVPLAFCSSLYNPTGDHLVYRHTFKKPKSGDEEIRVLSAGDAGQQFRAFVYRTSRESYETVPGMSYVGITSRSWQERYLEHTEKALEESSSTHFHNAIRDMQGKKVVCVHDVSAYGIPKDAAKAYESELIKKSTLWPLGLNMKS